MIRSLNVTPLIFGPLVVICYNKDYCYELFTFTWDNFLHSETFKIYLYSFQNWFFFLIPIIFNWKHWQQYLSRYLLILLSVLLFPLRKQPSMWRNNLKQTFHTFSSGVHFTGYLLISAFTLKCLTGHVCITVLTSSDEKNTKWAQMHTPGCCWKITDWKTQ